MNQKLNQLLHHLGEIWSRLGINQRINVALAAVVVLIGLGGLGYWSSRTEFALLYGRLEDAEAAKVVAVLDAAKVPYTTGAGSIYVAADKVHTMRMQLAAKGIPKADGGTGFEIFDKANFGISDFVQRANYLRAMQGELARTIGQLDSVSAARVMLVIPENRLLVDNQKHPTASVFVQLRGNTPLAPEAVSAIQFLVANAVEGLQANYVSVVDNRGNVLSNNTDNDSIAGMTAGQLASRKNLELYLAKKAESMLEKVLGPGQAVVRVAAEVNTDTVTRSEEKFDPDNSVLRTSTTTDENTDTNGSSSGGVPGASANANTQTNAVAALPVNATNTRKKVTNQQFEINKVTSSTVQGAGSLKRVSAAVFIAAKIQGTGPGAKAAPRAPEELEKLRRIVQSAIGLQTGADAVVQGEVTLEEMPFNEQFAQEMTRQLESQRQLDFWLEIGRNALYIGLAAGMIFFFMRLFKRTSAEEIPIGVPIRHLGGNGNGNGNGYRFSSESQQINKNIAQVNLDTFKQIVKENPVNMTEAIRAWMNRSKPNTN